MHVLVIAELLHVIHLKIIIEMLGLGIIRIIRLIRILLRQKSTVFQIKLWVTKNASLDPPHEYIAC